MREKIGQRILEQIKKLAKENQKVSLNEFRIIVALERAIARLERHPTLNDHLVFKGGFVLLKTIDNTRFTRDVDALAIGISRESIARIVDYALKTDLGDGLWFGDVVAEDLKDQGPYGGFRFSCAYQIGTLPEKSKVKRLSRIHIDVGFGDALREVPDKQPMPSILNDAKPIYWSVYPIEYIFAEKLEALFARGSASSRAKDIYDMPLIFPKCSLDALVLAVENTFQNRYTELPPLLAGAARGFELSILRNAWPSAGFTTESQDFNSSWNSLLSALEAIDSYRSS